MSADNGIYILKTKGPILTEWRVAHCQGIDDIFYENTSGDDEVLLDYFGQSPIFTNHKDACKYAFKLYNEIMDDDFPICEHGIVEILINRPFPEPNNGD